MSNGSTGKMGYAIAEAAAQRGAEVILVSGPTALTPPGNIETISVMTAQDMGKALESRFSWATVLIMAAAVGDFRPSQIVSRKAKKDEWSGESLALERNPDILVELAQQRTHQLLVGFAAETENHLENGEKKLHQKKLDLVAINHVSGPDSAFGNETNEITLVTRSREPQHLARMPKFIIAHQLLDAIIPLFPEKQNLPFRRTANLRSL